MMVSGRRVADEVEPDTALRWEEGGRHAMQRGEVGSGGGPIACVKKSNDQWHAMCSEEADDRRHTEEARRGGRR
jgi:hypothetical protein